ncbi:MAG: type III secretion inner membrane ring lipoprotein SctJ [Zoogloeaceae bacterium]|jgi:type III secretion protein J|nr:type III secretion inner membrane ring lipoprotein SctJ [Zoogloeaceae bacterium]
MMSAAQSSPCSPRWSCWKALFLAGLLCLLAACQQELHSGLPEGEANRILATLLENGIDANKVSRGKNGFTITVEKSELVRALKILESHSLPREDFKNLGEVFSGQGMIASPTEEQARLAFAIEQELAGTFARIDGVLTARAHVVLERHDAATGTSSPSSAAVFLRHLPDSPVVDLQGKIKELCVQAVPGLVYEKVSVMLVPVRAEVLLPDASNAQPRQSAAGTGTSRGLLGAALAAFLVFLAAGFFYVRRKKHAARKEAS